MKIDSELRGILKTSLPLVVVELVASLYSLTDTYFVSGLGAEALAALGISGYIIMLLQTFNTLFVVPLMVFTSQCIGAGKRDLARLVTGEVIFLGLVTVIVLSLAWFSLGDKIVKLQSGASGLTFMYATSYLRIRIAGFVALYLTMSFDSMIIASGATVYSMIANSVGLALNAVLDPLMIYGYFGLPALGVNGAALATVVSNAVSIPIQLYFLKGLKLVPLFSMQPSTWRKSLDLGIPAFIERAVFALGNNVYAGIIARLGSVVMAAHNIGLRIESLIYMPGFAFSMTASALVGKYVGSGQLSEAKRAGWKAIVLGTLVVGVLGVIVGLTGYYLAQPFSPSEEIRKLASLYLALAGFSEFGLGAAMITSGAFRGAGNTRIPMLVNVSSLLLIRITLSLLLAGPLGALGPWLAMFIDVYVRGAGLLTLYKCTFEKLAKKIV
ncbi:MAG: MATE family efflux transporter [Desulfurococcaceae archaeon]